MTAGDTKEYFKKVGQVWYHLKEILRDNNYVLTRSWNALKQEKIPEFLTAIGKKEYTFQRFREYALALRELDDERRDLERELGWKRK